MADRVVLMRDGRIEQIGEPLELYDRPANAFVAQFIGLPTMNMLRGRARPNGQGYTLETAEGLHLPLPADAAVSDGQPIILGLRPEHLAIASDGLPCAVELTEPLGREILVYGTIGESPVCIAPGSRPAIETGSKIGIAYDVKRACVFDGGSERSVRRER